MEKISFDGLAMILRVLSVNTEYRCGASENYFFN